MYLDIIIAVIMLFAIIEGIISGFLLQFFSLFGVYASFLSSKKITPIAIEKFGIESENIKSILAYIVVFLVSQIVVSIIVTIIKNILKNQSKGFITRFLGMLIGVLKGIVISFIILIIFNYVSNGFENIKKYGEKSVVNSIFLEEIDHFDNYIPEGLKKEINYEKGKKLVEKYF